MLSRPRGAIRLFDRVNRLVATRPSTLQSLQNWHFSQFSALSMRSVPPTDTSDRVPLRKQLKQEAKALKSQKRQRKESEEASRRIWELTVGVEIHAQLDTTAKLFSRRSPSNFSFFFLKICLMLHIAKSYHCQVLPRPPVIVLIPMSPYSI